MANSVADSIQIFMNSAHADTYLDTTNANCVFLLPYITAPTGHYLHISVVNATIPYSFYNINKYNNNINYTEFNGNVIVNSNYYELPYGNYNAYQLCKMVSTLLPNMVCTYDVLYNKFLFDNSVNAFRFDETYSFGGVHLLTSRELLGLSLNPVYNISPIVGYRLTSYRPINLASIRCINIITNYNCGNVSILEENNFNTLCSIPVIAQPNSLVYYENSNNFSTNLYIGEFNNISIRLTDQDGNQIDLNGQYFNMTLQIDVMQFT